MQKLAPEYHVLLEVVKKKYDEYYDALNNEGIMIDYLKPMMDCNIKNLENGLDSLFEKIDHQIDQIVTFHLNSQKSLQLSLLEDIYYIVTHHGT